MHGVCRDDRYERMSSSSNMVCNMLFSGWANSFFNLVMRVSAWADDGAWRAVCAALGAGRQLAMCVWCV